MPTWMPSAALQQLRFRSEMLGRIRDFMDRRSISEVNTPVLTRAGITEPQIESIALADGCGFLRTSPEYFHKRLLAAGFGDLYEIGPVFRQGEHGRMHRTEFSLLEWYRVGRDWRALAEETAELIMTCTPPEQPEWRVRFQSWSASFKACLDFDPLIDTRPAEAITRTELPVECDLGMRLDFLFSQHIQASFPGRQLTVVHGYPAAQAALARLDPADQRLACRFEVFAGPLELANGYQELTDPVEQRQRFERDNRRRRQLGLPAMPIDESLLAALESGLPACSGVALGVERLLMAVAGAEDLGEVMAFG